MLFEEAPVRITEEKVLGLEKLMAERYPVYGLADITVTTRDVRREEIMAEVLDALSSWLDREERSKEGAA